MMAAFTDSQLDAPVGHGVLGASGHGTYSEVGILRRWGFGPRRHSSGARCGPGGLGPVGGGIEQGAGCPVLPVSGAGAVVELELGRCGGGVPRLEQIRVSRCSGWGASAQVQGRQEFRVSVDVARDGELFCVVASVAGVDDGEGRGVGQTGQG